MRFLGLALAAMVINQTAVAATSVSQFGITWIFSNDRPVGQYANGDWWVLGPVTITKITPESVTNSSGWTKNGTMVNPAAGPYHGFDSSASGFLGVVYSSSLNKAPSVTGAPLVLSSGSVVSVISRTTPGTASTRPQVTDAAVLTVVSSAPAAGAFRPPPVGSDKTSYWNKDQLDYSILQSLAPVAGTPALSSVESFYEQPWFAQMEGSPARYVAPLNNMPEYGRDQAQLLSYGLLSLHLNYSNAQKEKLYIRLVQYGIDLYGAVKAGLVFLDYGGLNAGRKAPLVLAAMALNDANMKVYADAKQKFVFHDDRQTFFVIQSDVGRVMYTADGRPRETYRQEHVGIAEWGEQHIKQQNRDASNWVAYYRHINGGPLLGHALMAMLLKGGREAWNWEPFFVYADRFWSLEGANGYSNQTSAAPNNINAFVHAMWAAYRGVPPPVTTGKVVTPQFSPTPGNYDAPQTVSITSTTPGAAIHYTINGSDPTTSDSLYSTPLTISSSAVLKARGFKSGLGTSLLASASYTIGTAPPTISPGGGEIAILGGNFFSSPVVVTMQCPTAGASIHYTTDGSEPTTSSKLYQSPFNIVSGLNPSIQPPVPFDPGLIVPPVNLKAIAVKSGTATSPVQNALFNFGPFSSDDEWTNIRISPRAAAPGLSTFTLLFDYVPGENIIDGVIGLAGGEAQAYKDLACIVRFNPTGFIDARNGGAYTALNSMPYQKGIRYRVEMTVDMASRTYNAKVLANPTVDSLAGYVEIAKNYAFRTEQAAASEINYVALSTVANEMSRILVLNSRPNAQGTPRGSDFKLEWTP